MSRIIEIKLHLAAALPLIDRIKALADTADAGLEVKMLLERFHPPFAETGVIAISEAATPAVLRASSFLRFQIRRGVLATLPDAVLEGDLDPRQYSGAERTEVDCYQFLIQVQAALLENLPATAFRANPVVRRFDDFVSALRHLFRRGDSWQVGLRNDPVNSMRYVVTALQGELDLTETAAQECVDEIIRTQNAVVWQGPRAQAEVRFRALQAWHLDAVLKPVTAPK